MTAMIPRSTGRTLAPLSPPPPQIAQKRKEMRQVLNNTSLGRGSVTGGPSRGSITGGTKRVAPTNSATMLSDRRNSGLLASMRVASRGSAQGEARGPETTPVQLVAKDNSCVDPGPPAAGLEGRKV